MPVLIDGDNLLGTWPGRKRSDAERRSLAMAIGRLAHRERRRYVTVFDGHPPAAKSFGTDVHFSGRGRSADELILELLRKESDRRGWTVVTSDRSLGDQCRYLEARVLRCDRFRGRLRADPRTEKPERETDVDYWLEQFGDDDASNP